MDPRPETRDPRPETRERVRIARILVAVVAALLIATGLMKLSALLTEDPVLARPIPLFFFVPNRFVLVVAGAVETRVGITALKTRRVALLHAITFQGCLLVWFVTYRAASAFVAPGRPCGCFGFFNRLLYQGTGFDPAKALLTALLFCCALCTRTIAAAERGQYLVEGDLDMVQLSLDERVVTTQETRFVVRADYPKWNIVLQTKQWPESPDEYYHDGTNTLHVLHNAQMNALMEGFVQIGNVKFPGADYRANLVWLAFASSRYISSGTNEIYALWQQSTSVAGLCSTGQVTVSEQPPYLPDRVSFLFSTQATRAASTNPMLLVESPYAVDEAIRGLLRTYADGEEMGLYRVTNYTNCLNGFLLPAGFRFTSFARGHDRKYRSFVVTGRVRRIVPLVDPLDCPVPPEGTVVTVSDSRFANAAYRISGLLYKLTNSYYVATNEQRIASLYQSRVDKARAEAPYYHRKRSTVLILAVLLAGIPTGLLVISRMKNQTIHATR